MPATPAVGAWMLVPGATCQLAVAAGGDEVNRHDEGFKVALGGAVDPGLKGDRIGDEVVDVERGHGGSRVVVG